MLSKASMQWSQSVVLFIEVQCYNSFICFTHISQINQISIASMHINQMLRFWQIQAAKRKRAKSLMSLNNMEVFEDVT